MHPRIGTATSDDGVASTKNSRQRCLDFALYCPAVGLPLPPLELRPVKLQLQPQRALGGGCHPICTALRLRVGFRC